MIFYRTVAGLAFTFSLLALVSVELEVYHLAVWSGVAAAVSGLCCYEIRRLRRILCVFLGHSRIQTHCLGYFCCARCDDEVGNMLASRYDASSVVVVDHDCDQCRENYAKLTWRDKLLSGDPGVSTNQ